MCAGRGRPQAMAFAAAVLLAATFSMALAETFQGGWVPLTAPCPTCRNSRDVARDAARPQAADASQFQHPPPLPSSPAAAFVNQQVQQHFLQQRPDIQQLIGRPSSQQPSALLPPQILAPPTAQGFLQPSALNLAALLQLQQLQHQQQQALLALPLATPPPLPAFPEVQQSTPRPLNNVTEAEEVQLLYVPVETLRQRGRLQAEQKEAPHQEKREEQQVQRQQQVTPAPRQRSEQHSTRGQQRQQATTSKPAPHTPPLSVFMDNEGRAVRIPDVVRVLKAASMVDVLDTVGPDSPQIFVGPSNLETPEGYTKFELPYLSSVESNRVERRVDKLPFFVAPLSFKPPPGYSKIPFPPPHVGSVVVSSDASPVTERNSVQEKSTESTIINSRGRQPNTYSLPPDLPPINPQLPSLVNSLEDPGQRGQNVLLVPQNDQLSTSSPTQIPTRQTYIFKQSQRNNLKSQEPNQYQQKSQLQQLSPTRAPQETFLVQPQSQYQSQAAVAQEGESLVPSIAPTIPQLQLPPHTVQQQPASHSLQGQFLNHQLATQESITSSRVPNTQKIEADRNSQTGRQLQRGRFQPNLFTGQEIVSESPLASAQAPTQDSPVQLVADHFQRGQLHPTQFPTHTPNETPRRQIHSQNNQNQRTVNQLQHTRFQQNSLSSHQENTVSDTPSVPVQNERFRSMSNQPQRSRYNQNQYANENPRAQTEAPPASVYVQTQPEETSSTTERFLRGRLQHSRLTDHTTERMPIVEQNLKATLTPASSVATQTLTATTSASQPTGGQQGAGQTIDSVKFQEYLDHLISNPQSSGPLIQTQEALQRLRDLIAQNPLLLSPQDTKTAEQDSGQQNPSDKQIYQKEVIAGFPQNPTAEAILPEQQSIYTTTTVSTTFGSFRRQPNRGRQRITTSTYAPALATTHSSRRSYPRNRRPAQTRSRYQEPTTTTSTTTTTTTTTTEIPIPNQNYESQASIQNYQLPYLTQNQQQIPAQNFGSASTIESYQKSPEIESLVQNSQYEEQTEIPKIVQSLRTQQNVYNQPIRQAHHPKRQQQDFAITTTTYKPPPSYESSERGLSQRNHRFRGRQRAHQITQQPLLPKDETFADNNPSLSVQQSHQQYSDSHTQLRQTQQTTTEQAPVLQQDTHLQPDAPILPTQLSQNPIASTVQELQPQIQTLQQSHINIDPPLQFQQQQYQQAGTESTLSSLQPIAAHVYQETEVSPVLDPQQVVPTFQTPESNPVILKSSEYEPLEQTSENLSPLQRNGPRYTNIHRNRQRAQPNVVYQESFTQNQVQPDNTDNARPEEQNQNYFGGYRFDETSHQVTTTPRTIIEETSRPIHAKLRGRVRTRQRAQGSELTSRRNQYSGSNRQEPTQEEGAYGFIQTTVKPLFLENFSEESAEQIPVLQRIRNAALQSVQNSEHEALEYPTTEVPSSSETPAQHIIRAGIKKKIRGSRRSTTTVAPAPTTTATENTHKVYTVRPIRRPSIKTKLVSTKARIRRPTPPTTTPSTQTTVPPALQATAPDWEQRRPGAHRLPYSGSNEVITQTARSPLPKYSARQSSNTTPWNQNPTEAFLHATGDFNVNLGDNVNQPSSAQWTPPQDGGFFINFGQTPENVPYDQVGMGSQRQSSYNEEQKGAESQRYSTIYMLPPPTKEIKEPDELPDGSPATTALPSAHDDITTIHDDQKKEHLTTELNIQSAEESEDEDGKYNDLKKTADPYSTIKKSVHGRRRGAWVRVRVTPSRQDILEAAESQNLATASFNAISPPPLKATQLKDDDSDGPSGSDEANWLYTSDVQHLPPEEVTTAYPAAATTTLPPTERTTIDTADLSSSATTVQTYYNHKSEYDDAAEQQKEAANHNTHAFRNFWDMAAYIDSFLPASRGYDDDGTSAETSDLHSTNATNWQSETLEQEEYNTRGGENIGADSEDQQLTTNEQVRYDEPAHTTTEAITDVEVGKSSTESSTNKNDFYDIELHSNNTREEIKSKEIAMQHENTYLGQQSKTKSEYVPNDPDNAKNEEKLREKFSYKVRVQYRPNNLDDIRKPILKIDDQLLASNTSSSDILESSDSKESNSNLIATSDSEQHRYTDVNAGTGVKKSPTPSQLKKNKQKPPTLYTSPIYDAIQDIISKVEKYDSNESTEPEINFEIQKMNPRTSTTEPLAMEQLRILGTSTSTEVSHETEICYRGRCVKTKTKTSDQVPVE